jgi:phage terminase small subunit
MGRAKSPSEGGRTKAVVSSTSKETAARRRAVFAERYLVNGNNATEAGIFAGLSEKTAYSSAQRMLKDPKTQELLGNRVTALLVDAKLTTERWAKEMACLAHFDPGELYDEAGHLIPMGKLPEHVRRAIASVEVDTDSHGTTTKKVKLWDKNTALANVGKHLGMFEQDNRQKAVPIQVVVQLMG